MPKIVGSSIQEHREHIRRKLFAALSELMAVNNFEGISLSDIAHKAGVGRTAVYNHFADKESLLLGYIHDETHRYVDQLRKNLIGVNDPVDRLRIYVRAQVQLRRDFHMPSGPELHTVMSKSTREKLRDHAILVEEILRSIIMLGIATNVFPRQDISSTIMMVNCCLSSRSLPAHAVANKKTAVCIEEFILRAVGTPPARIVQHQNVGLSEKNHVSS